MKDTLLDSETRLHFAGHETFPLRLLWLKKAHDAVSIDGPGKRTFQELNSIARFGVGKNMVLSMRHWAQASGMIEPAGVGYRPTSLAKLLLDNSGLDPFLEDPATLWLVHAALAGGPSPCTTFYFAFNVLNQAVFDRDGLNEALVELARNRGLRATAETVKRDVEVFLRSYVRRGDDSGDDASEPLLAELSLIRESRLAGQFEFARGPQPSLPNAVFALQLIRFWKRMGEPPTLTAEAVAYGHGGPGRVFKMDEDSVVTRLTQIAELTDNALVWTDTAGLRQVNFVSTVDEERLIALAYVKAAR